MGLLRITVKEIASEQRWILQGRLTECTVAELVSNWRATRSHPAAKNRVVELDEVVVIDKSGEEVLSMMIADGARFEAKGLYTKTSPRSAARANRAYWQSRLSSNRSEGLT